MQQLSQAEALQVIKAMAAQNNETAGTKIDGMRIGEGTIHIDTVLKKGEAVIFGAIPSRSDGTYVTESNIQNERFRNLGGKYITVLVGRKDDPNGSGWPLVLFSSRRTHKGHFSAVEKLINQVLQDEKTRDKYVDPEDDTLRFITPYEWTGAQFEIGNYITDEPFRIPNSSTESGWSENGDGDFVTLNHQQITFSSDLDEIQTTVRRMYRRLVSQNAFVSMEKEEHIPEPKKPEETESKKTGTNN